MSKTAYVLHHGDPDGFGAAYAAWLKFGDDAEYVEVEYGQEIPGVPDGSRLYLLDFAYPEEVLDDLYRRMEYFCVVDHHKSNGHLASKVYMVYTPDTHSACVATWKWLFRGSVNGGNQMVPLLLRYVEDRDLWKWELPESDAVNAMIYSTEKVFQEWLSLDSALSTDPHRVVERGRAILRYRDRLVEDICAQAVIDDFLGYDVPRVVCPVLQSEIGHRLLELYPDSPFAVIERPRLAEGFTSYSMRSRGDFDVSKLAKENGGGGHKAAAGFEVKGV